MPCPPIVCTFLAQKYYPTSSAKHKNFFFLLSQVGRRGSSFPQKYNRRKATPQNPLIAHDSKTPLPQDGNKNTYNQQALATVTFIVVKGASACLPSPALHTVTAEHIRTPYQSVAVHRVKSTRTADAPPPERTLFSLQNCVETTPP